jgi:hypothetical protein
MRRILFRLARFMALTAGFTAGLVTFTRAGAWTPDPGHGEVIVTTLFDQADVAFNQAGHFTPTQLYVDVGVTDGLAALIKPTVQSSTLGAPENQRYTGLGDSEIGAQARLCVMTPAF